MREYDQQIGRFFRVDPLSEKFFYLTPYQYASNNPSSNIDIDGLKGLNFNSPCVRAAFSPNVQTGVKKFNQNAASAFSVNASIGPSIGGKFHLGKAINVKAEANCPQLSGSTNLAGNSTIQANAGGQPGHSVFLALMLKQPGKSGMLKLKMIKRTQVWLNLKHQQAPIF